jgi:hypothetical protein
MQHSRLHGNDQYHLHSLPKRTGLEWLSQQKLFDKQSLTFVQLSSMLVSSSSGSSKPTLPPNVLETGLGKRKRKREFKSGKKRLEGAGNERGVLSTPTGNREKW